MSSKLNEKIRKQIYSVILVFLLFTLVCLFTNLISAYKQFLIGSFGLVIYPILFLSICVCVLKLMNKSFALDSKSLLYCILVFVAFLGILQMALTRNFDYSSFPAYIENVYSSSLTPGGVVIGTMIFPFKYFLHEIATYIIFSIALIILVACAIDNYYFKMAKLMRKNSVNRSSNSQLAVNEIKKALQENENKRDDNLIETLDSNKMLDDAIENEEIDDERRIQEERYARAKDLLGLNSNKNQNLNSSNAHDVLYGDENSKKKAISTLYPNRVSSFGTIGSEEYLQDSLEKYMPTELKRRKYNLNLDENKSNSSRSNARMESDKISSIEYLNRTIPKTAQKGTIIRGDYYKSSIDSCEKVEIVGNDEYDYNSFNFSNNEDCFVNNFNKIEPSNEQEVELSKILANSHSFTPDEVIENSLNLYEEDMFNRENEIPNEEVENIFTSKQEEKEVLVDSSIVEDKLEQPQRKPNFITIIF